MGFFTPSPLLGVGLGYLKSQSLSGWDGVFHLTCRRRWELEQKWSQSLSGWDGVFHFEEEVANGLAQWGESQSLSGWDGVFHKGGRDE